MRANHSDPRHAPGESARVRPLLRPAARAQGRCLRSAASRAAECCAHAVSGDAPNMCVESRCESRNASEPQRSPTRSRTTTIATCSAQSRALPPRGALPHCFSRRFSRGGILIGALSKGSASLCYGSSGGSAKKRGKTPNVLSTDRGDTRQWLASPPRVVFVLGLVSLINSLTSGKIWS